MNTMEEYYEQNPNVNRLHNFPRFGNTNRLSNIADEDDKDGYIQGLLGCTIFCLCFFAVWSGTLMLLKCCGGLEHVGCAAGGEVINVSALREMGVRRWQRRNRIARSWRIQSIFAIASFGLITFSFVFVNHGLTPFMESLDSVALTTSIVHTRLLQGTHLTHLLSTHMALLQPYVELDVKNLCPNYEESESILDTEFSLAVTGDEIRNALRQMDSFVQKDLGPLLNGIDKVADACSSLGSAIIEVQESDWMVRLTLVTVNFINIFLFVGVVLTRNKIFSRFYQGVLGSLLVPAFSFAVIVVVAILCIITVTALVNADFCAGGAAPGSPHGTLAEMVTASGYERDGFINQTLYYYTANQCEGQNPLLFLHELEIALVETSGRVTEMTRSFQAADSHRFSGECEADFSQVNSTFSTLAPILVDVTTAVERLNDLVKCEDINPILDEFAYGPICHDTIDSATWMYYTWLVIVLLIMIMLSTRAALFNTLIPVPKKKRREKEFRQYKRFMEQHGFDTSDWILDPPKAKKLGDIKPIRTATFDTEDTDSTLRITPEARDESSEASFDDEYRSEDDEGRQQYQQKSGLETLAEVDGEDEEESVVSADSDDSSLNGPPTVFSNMASSMASGVTTALRKIARVRTYSSSAGVSFDETVESNGRQRKSFHTPNRQERPVENILGPMDESLGDSEDDERVPLSPPLLQPVAPKKALKNMRRTRGSSNMTWGK